MSQRVFTIQEVDALIPELSRRVGIQLTIGTEIESLVRRLARETGEPVASVEENPNDRPSVRKLRAQARDLITRYQSGWDDIQDLGAVVKDTSMGLLDFYGRLEGRLVWLCWRFGETKLTFYHELDSGFSGRRELGTDTRHRVLN